MESPGATGHRSLVPRNLYPYAPRVPPGCHYAPALHNPPIAHLRSLCSLQFAPWGPTVYSPTPHGLRSVSFLSPLTPTVPSLHFVPLTHSLPTARFGSSLHSSPSLTHNPYTHTTHPNIPFTPWVQTTRGAQESSPVWSGLRSCVDSVGIKGCLSLRGEARVGWGWNGGPGLRGLGHSAHTVHSIPLPLVLPTTIRALFSTVSPLSSHEVDERANRVSEWK